MALQRLSDVIQTDDSTEDSHHLAVTTESTVARRPVLRSLTYLHAQDEGSGVTEPAAARRHVLRAFTYLHVQDEDTGVIRLVTGPCSYTLKPNKRVTLGPQSMVVVPSAHYCIVESPVVRADGIVAFDDFDQARLRHGEREVRLHQPPFPLYPGETLACSVQPLPMVAGVSSLRLRAVQDTTDSEGTQRKVGDEWLVKKKGAYIPSVGEEVVEVLQLITLTSRQYCSIYIPVMDDKPRFKIMQGPQSFFLQPGEVLEDSIHDICFLEANEGLDLIARGAFTDETVTPAVTRSPGDRWTVRGPAAVAPPFQADVLRRRSAIPLGPDEGVYVENTLTGEVRVEMGKPYLLMVDERLWSKELPADVEKILAKYRRDTMTGAPVRDKTRVVSIWLPQGLRVKIENHMNGTVREECGPKRVTLLPDEQFQVWGHRLMYEDYDDQMEREYFESINENENATIMEIIGYRM